MNQNFNLFSSSLNFDLNFTWLQKQLYNLDQLEFSSATVKLLLRLFFLFCFGKIIKKCLLLDMSLLF